MNYWVIAFPCLIYLASIGTYSTRCKPPATPLTNVPDIGMGIMFIYRTSQPTSISDSLASNTGIPYFSISISLNILLTLMIVGRLVLHSRNIRNALGTQAGGGGMYKALVTMIIESSALYAVSSILFIVPWGANSWVADIFLPILAQNQVRASP